MNDAQAVLITGGRGFIGRHLAAALSAHGVPVRQWVGDVRDAAAVQDAADGVGVIYHLAARVYNADSIRDPAGTLAVNLGGTLNVLEAAGHVGARVVLASSANVYGTPLYSPLDERHPFAPRTPYAASKIAAEALAISFWHSRGVPVSIARLFNIYGPGQAGDALLPTIFEQAARGGVVMLGALTPIRDWLYVADAVDGLIACGIAQSAIGEVFNFGSGIGLSVGVLARRAVALINPGIMISARGDASHADDPAALPFVAAIDKAHERLGWAPRVPLDDGLRRTLATAETPLSLP